MDKGIEALIADIRLKHGAGDVYAPILRWDEFEMLAAAITRTTHHNGMMQLSNELAEMKPVKLPELCMGVVQSGKAVMIPYSGGHWLNKTAVIEAIRTAGGTVEGD